MTLWFHSFLFLALQHFFQADIGLVQLWTKQEQTKPNSVECCCMVEVTWVYWESQSSALQYIFSNMRIDQLAFIATYRWVLLFCLVLSVIVPQLYTPENYHQKVILKRAKSTAALHRNKGMIIAMEEKELCTTLPFSPLCWRHWVGFSQGRAGWLWLCSQIRAASLPGIQLLWL